MNAYDFDKTIYQGDSSIDFYIYCIRKYPKLMTLLPEQIIGALKYKVGLIDKVKFKETFFSFLCKLDNPENDVHEFWNLNQVKIKPWYIEQKAADDLIISASPYFLLDDICNRLRITHLIATEVDIRTGRFISQNCKGKEKVIKFRNLYPDEKISNFYSDSLSDSYMASISRNAFLVKGDEIREWPSEEKKNR